MARGFPALCTKKKEKVKTKEKRKSNNLGLGESALFENAHRRLGVEVAKHCAINRVLEYAIALRRLFVGNANLARLVCVV